MYCMNCGTKNEDQAKFCAKCGQQLVAAIVNEKPKPARRKSKSLYMILTSLVLVITITTVTIFDLWPWSTKADKGASGTRTEQTDGDKTKQDDIQGGEQIASNDGVITTKNLNLDAIAGQCPDCQAALDTYIATLLAYQDWTTPKEEIDALENQKCAQMQHFCTAQAIYVEDIPYVYNGSYGLYTGDWIGAGPAGEGTYIGTVYGNNIVSYTGAWGFGVPNGEGELYLENYFGDWDMTYMGQLKNGKRDGEGSWFEYCDDGYHAPRFRIYDRTIYSQNQLTDWIDCVEYYEETGEIYQYCKMKTDELGRPLQGETWEPGELSPEMRDALGLAGAIGILGFTVCLTGYGLKKSLEGIDDNGEGNRAMLAEVNAWREQRDIEAQESLKREEERQKNIRRDNRNECERLEALGETDTSYYKSCYAYSYY